MCRGETRSLHSVAEVSILRLCLSRGLDARGCRLLRRRGVMPWWRRGSYATTPSLLRSLFLSSPFLSLSLSRPPFLCSSLSLSLPVFSLFLAPPHLPLPSRSLPLSPTRARACIRVGGGGDFSSSLLPSLLLREKRLCPFLLSFSL